MPRARKPPPQTPYQRRQARARALGYRSYYDYRTHDHGKLPPSAPRPTGEARQRLRGHRGTVDLISFLRAGDLIVMPNGVGNVELGSRKRETVYVEIVKLVLPASPRRKSRTFTLRNVTRSQLVTIIAQERARGAIWSPAPSLDQRRLVSREHDQDGY